MASTITTFDFAMKERYVPEKVEALMFSDRPLLAKIAKDETLSGDQVIQPLIYGAPQGLSATLGATAMDIALAGTGANVSGVKFTVPVGGYNAWVEIGDKAIVLSRDNPGAFLENKVAEIDNLYEQASDVLATYLYGNGGFAIGRRSSISTNTITLTTAEDVINFEVGMYLKASAADGSTVTDSLRAGTSPYVTAIDRESGTVTVNDASLITSFADLDSLFRLGDFAGDQGTTIIKGVGAYISATASPAALYGVTRTTDVQRLAGCRLTAAQYTGLNNEERLRQLASRMTGIYKGPGCDQVYLNPVDWENLSIALSTRGIRPLDDDSTQFGFSKLELVMGGKRVEIYADRFAPRGVAWLFKMNTWKLRSALKLLHPLNGDGMTMLRKASTNDYQYRLVSYPALTCSAPGWNGRTPLAA